MDNGHYYSPFDFSFFNVVFSNLTFAYMMQHSLPAMIGHCRPEKKIKPTLMIVFAIGFISVVSISFLGICAFGGDMAVKIIYIYIIC